MVIKYIYQHKSNITLYFKEIIVMIMILICKWNFILYKNNIIKIQKLNMKFIL